MAVVANARSCVHCTCVFAVGGVGVGVGGGGGVRVGRWVGGQSGTWKGSSRHKSGSCRLISLRASGMLHSERSVFRQWPFRAGLARWYREHAFIRHITPPCSNTSRLLRSDPKHSVNSARTAWYWCSGPPRWVTMAPMIAVTTSAVMRASSSRVAASCARLQMAAVPCCWIGQPPWCCTWCLSMSEHLWRCMARVMVPMAPRSARSRR
mmetsp:Transcript_27118/g.68107  ORF Transcript_27118/g.68107 Transcript_27118/m.68107 type:complete len:208 (+) Transcript_27118:101-724(+)